MVEIFFLLLSHWIQEPTPQEAPTRQLDAGACRRAFEEGLEADDLARIEALVAASATHCVPLFEQYAEIWIQLKGEPSARERKALARARALAEAVDSAL